MINLNGKFENLSDSTGCSGLLRLTTNESLPFPLRKQYGLVSDTSNGDGFKIVIRKNAIIPSSTETVKLSEEIHHLDNGDIISIGAENNQIRVLFRKI